MSLDTIHHFHVCGGIGSGAAGFNDAVPVVGKISGRMVCTGGIDVDPRACADFKQLTGVEQACRDLFTVGQYQAFHGHMPEPGWRELLPEDVRAASHGIFPNIVFTSMPCKGFSGLLSSSKSGTAKYIALNELTERGVWLTMEAFADDPPDLFIFENVPRIATRGRYLLDRIGGILQHFGYAKQETQHDCGEIGALGQSRKRFLLVARHTAKVPAFLYQPEKRRLRSVGDVLQHLPLPGDPAAGPMHRVPQLHWKTWVRLAFVEAGSDWRSLNKLAVEDGVLRDYLIVPSTQEGSGAYGVTDWAEHAKLVAGRSGPSNGPFSVADPRAPEGADQFGQYGVNGWNDSMGAVISVKSPGQGGFSVADPRYGDGPAGPHFANVYRVVRWDQPSPTVTTGGSPSASGTSVADPRMNWNAGAHQAKLHVTDWADPHQAVTGARGPYSGAAAVADPRPDWNGRHGHLHVTEWDDTSRTVTAGGKGVQGGYLSVADPRPTMQRNKGDHFLTGGHYGVVAWQGCSGAVSASACHDNGNWSVADPRPMPAPTDKLVAYIVALDGTWHRPFTTLDLASLQSIIDPEEWFAPGGPGWEQPFVLDGPSDQRWREGIGNAVPRKAAKAIGTVMGQAILQSRMGITFQLSAQPVWVKPIALALTLPEAAT